VATEIPDQVRVLHGLVRYGFVDDAELMGTWASGRNHSLRSGLVVLRPFKPEGC